MSRLIAVALFVFAAAPMAVKAPTVLAAPGRCYNIQLNITPYRSSAGAGHVGVMYRVHNLWTGACTLGGYPGAELLGAKFHSLPTHLTRGLGYLVGKRPVQLVTLAGNNDAYFVLEWDQIQTEHQPCQVARYFMITPPNDNLPDVTWATSNAGFIRACSGMVTASPVASKAFNF